MKAIEKIMLLEGARTAAELAQKLGVPKGTVDTWKSRGKVPEKVIRGWAIKHGKTVEWFTSDEDGGGAKEKPLESALRRLVDQVCDEVVATAKTPKEELELIEDFLAFKRRWLEKKEKDGI